MILQLGRIGYFGRDGVSWSETGANGSRWCAMAIGGHCGRFARWMMWGAQAQAKAGFVDAGRHLVLTAPHPLPLSMHLGFWLPALGRSNERCRRRGGGGDAEPLASPQQGCGSGHSNHWPEPTAEPALFCEVTEP